MTLELDFTPLSYDEAEVSHREDAPSLVFGRDKIHFMGADLFKNDDSSIILRFLDDFNNPQHGIFSLLTHSSVPTKPKPKDAPEKMPWFEQTRVVCRNQKQFASAFDSCWVCDNLKKEAKNGKYYPWPRSTTCFGRAILREAVKITPEMVAKSDDLQEEHINKKIIQDVTEEVPVLNDKGEETGETTRRPIVLLINKQDGNFWSALKVNYQHNDETILDRNYVVTKTGKDFDVKYNFIGRNPDGEDMRNPEDRAPYEDILTVETVKKHIIDMVSDDHLHKFVDPSVEYDWSANSSNSSAASEAPEEQPKQTEEEVSAEARAASQEEIRNSLMSNSRRKIISD